MVCQTDVWIDKPLKSHSIQKLCTFGKIHTWGDAHKPQSQNPSPKPKPWPSLQTNDDTMKPNWPHNKPKQSINVGGCMIEPKNAFFEELFKRNFTRAKFHWDFWIDNHWKVILYKNPTLLYRMVLERAFGSSVSMHFAKSKKWFQYRTGRKHVCHFLPFFENYNVVLSGNCQAAKQHWNQAPMELWNQWTTNPGLIVCQTNQAWMGLWN